MCRCLNFHSESAEFVEVGGYGLCTFHSTENMEKEEKANFVISSAFLSVDGLAKLALHMFYTVKAMERRRRIFVKWFYNLSTDGSTSVAVILWAAQHF